MTKAGHDPIIIDGKAVSDATFDEWAKEYEDSSWPGKLGEVVMGRPRIHDEPLVSITVRMPKGQVRAIETMAKRKGQTRSEYLREVAAHAVMEDGLASSG
jgi:hypothetical protein